MRRTPSSIFSSSSSCIAWRKYKGKNGSKGKLLYGAVSNLLVHSKHFTLCPLEDLFIPTETRLLWEAFGHAEISVQGLINQISTTVYTARYSFEQQSQLRRRGENENAQTSQHNHESEMGMC